MQPREDMSDKEFAGLKKSFNRLVASAMKKRHAMENEK
jgi:hypothetical protein